MQQLYTSVTSAHHHLTHTNLLCYPRPGPSHCCAIALTRPASFLHLPIALSPAGTGAAGRTGRGSGRVVVLVLLLLSSLALATISLCRLARHSNFAA
jgi:hypothetical protein